MGICYGMHAVVDVARNCADLAGAHSTEITPDTPHPVIGLITEWTDDSGSVEQRDADSDLGGTMRLQPGRAEPGCPAERVYGQSCASAIGIVTK